MGISTVGKAWDCKQEVSTTVLGSTVQIPIRGGNFFAEFVLRAGSHFTQQPSLEIVKMVLEHTRSHKVDISFLLKL